MDKAGLVVTTDARGIRWTPELVDTLRRLYPTTLSDELATIFGTSEFAIRSAARRYGIVKDRDWLKRLRTSFCKQAAALYGVENGKRNGPRSRRIFFNEKYFSEPLTEKSAYWLGFIQADGSIRIKPHVKVLQLTLAMRDADHLDQFLSDLDANIVARRYPMAKVPCATIHLTSSQMVNDLMTLGVMPNKTGLGTFPIVSDELTSHYLRGVFDGDGNISLRKDRRLDPTASLVGSEAFVRWAAEVIRKQTGIQGGRITKHSKRNVWYFHIAGRRQVLEFGYWLYRGATRWLARKRAIFELLQRGSG